MSSVAAASPAPATPGDGVLHPIVLCSLALLALNDHALKRLFPGTLTGKLSDLAGLVLAPAVLVAGVELARRRVLSTRALALACLATSVAFALVKTWAPATECYRTVWSLLQWPALSLRAGAVLPVGSVSVVRDPTDLFALPAALAAYAVGRGRTVGG